MIHYIPPDPSVAEYVHNKNEEMRAYRTRFEPLSDAELKAVLRNQDDAASRPFVLGILMERLARSRDRDPDSRRNQLTGLLEEFLDDPHPHIAKVAISYCPMTEQRMKQVYKMVDSSHDEVKAAAAIALAKSKDERIFPKLLEWFHGSNEGHRNLAIEALRTLNTDHAKKELQNGYDEGSRGESDRVVLAIALLNLGDERGVDFLNCVAERAEGAWSCVAAVGLYHQSEPDVGLKLMLHILDEGDNDAKRWMVNQICFNFTHSPHAFTADGIHEARLWVQRKLESPNKFPTP